MNPWVFLLSLRHYIEVVLKVTALGLKTYLRDAWNRFDVAVVAVSVAGVVVTFTTETSASYLSLLRVFRIARAFRLIKRAKGGDAQPGALVIGRHYIIERDSVPVQYNGIV